MPKLRITRRAGEDLDDIQSHGLRDFGPEATRAYMIGFDHIFARLEDYPLSGARADEFGRVVRSCSHPPYRVFYRFEAEIVSILRVAHTAQRPQTIDDTRP